MARREADREDLFLEARGLEPRLEFSLGATTVVCGLGKGGGLSVYVGQDEMFRFGPRGGLWRAFVVGNLYRAEPGRRLTRLSRKREPGATMLLARALSASETDRLLAEAAARLAQVREGLAHILADRSTARVRVMPAGAEESVIAALHQAVSELLARPLQVANGPADR